MLLFRDSQDGLGHRIIAIIPSSFGDFNCQLYIHFCLSHGLHNQNTMQQKNWQYQPHRPGSAGIVAQLRALPGIARVVGINALRHLEGRAVFIISPAHEPPGKYTKKHGQNATPYVLPVSLIIIRFSLRYTAVSQFASAPIALVLSSPSPKHPNVILDPFSFRSSVPKRF